MPIATQLSYKLVRGTPMQEVTHLPLHTRSSLELGPSYHTNIFYIQKYIVVDSSPLLPTSLHFIPSTDLSVGGSPSVSPAQDFLQVLFPDGAQPDRTSEENHP